MPSPFSNVMKKLLHGTVAWLETKRWLGNKVAKMVLDGVEQGADSEIDSTLAPMFEEVLKSEGLALVDAAAFGEFSAWKAAQLTA